MADQSRHTLEIVAKLKDQAKGKLKTIGTEGEKAGARVEKSMKKVDTQAEKAGGSMWDAGQKGAKAASVAGASFAAMGGAVSLATIDLENTQQTMAGVATAASSVAAGFGAGGIAGGAIAAAAALGGLVVNLMSAKSRMQEFLDDVKERADKAAEAIKKVGTATAEAALSYRELEQVNQLLIKSSGRMERAEAVFIVAQEKKRKAIVQNQALMRKSIAETAAALEDAKRRMAATESTPGVGGLGEYGSYQDVAKLEKELERLKAQLDASYQAFGKLREEKDAFFDAKKSGQIVDAMAAREQSEKEITETTKERAPVVKEETDQKAIQAQKVALIAKLQAKANADAQRYDAAQRARAERAKDLNRTLDERLELLRATSDEDRERIRILQEKQRLLEAGADAAKVEELTTERLAKLEASRYKLVEDTVEKQKEGAAALAQQKRAAKELGDVTQAFHEVAGSGFGFGKHRGFGRFFSQRTRYKSGGSPGQAAASSAGGAGASVPDPTPAINAGTAEVQKIPAVFQKMVTAAEKHAAAVSKVVQSMQDKVSSFALKINKEIRALWAANRALEERLARAGNVKVG